MQGDTTTLKTDVDSFINLVKNQGRITINDAARKLGINESVVEAWADFLVEERILGIEYKFTTPYIFMNYAEKENNTYTYSGFETKQEFFRKAEKRKIPQYHIVVLWAKYLSANKDKIRNAFFDKAKLKGIPEEKIYSLWTKYYEQLRAG